MILLLVALGAIWLAAMSAYMGDDIWWAIVAVLVACWVVAVLQARTFFGLAHLLLMAAVAMAVVRLIAMRDGPSRDPAGPPRRRRTDMAPSS